MVNGMCAASIAAALSLATSLLTPVAVAAKSGGAGLGARSSLTAKPTLLTRPPVLHHRRAFNRGPLGGIVAGVAPYYYIAAAGDVPLLEGLDPPPPPPRVLSCRRSQETVTVPSEDGGERQIRITRC